MSEPTQPEMSAGDSAGRYPPGLDGALVRPISGRQPETSTPETSVAPTLPLPPAGTTADPDVTRIGSRTPVALPSNTEQARPTEPGPQATGPAPVGTPSANPPSGGIPGWPTAPDMTPAGPAGGAGHPGGPGRFSPGTSGSQPYQARSTGSRPSGTPVGSPTAPRPGMPMPPSALVPPGNRPIHPPGAPAVVQTRQGGQPTMMPPTGDGTLPYRARYPYPLPSSTPGGSTPARPPKRPNRRPLVVSGVLLLLLVMVGGFVLRLGVLGGTTQTRSLGDSPNLSHHTEETQAAAPIPTYHAEVTPELSRGVVLIFGASPQGGSAGTGMVLNSDGLVLTNYHVVAGTHELLVQVNDTGEKFPAHVVGRNLMADVAVVQLENATGLVPIVLSKQDVSPGDRVVAIGNAAGEGVLRGTGGSVSRVGATIWLDSAYGGYGEDPLMGVIESSAGAVPGYSGGPTFNESAEVIGITSAGQQEESPQMVSYTIPIDNAMHVVDQILTGEETADTRIGPRPMLGIDLGQEDIPQVHGVTNGSPAAEAGITTGCTIVEFNGTPVNRARTLLRLLDGTDPGQQVEIAWRDPAGEVITKRIALAENPAN